MKTITTVELELVTGGAYPLGTIDKPGSSGGNDQLLSTLTGIQSSLKDLSKNQNNQGLFGGQNGLLFVTALMLSQRNNTNTVVYQQGGGCAPRHGFRFRIW
ncbi:MAG TPA: hypothetical protein VMZ53_18755 [Kofleriaceae bacterium]|nr:hypothetical protein [Kofleriaceae bacterium]